MATHEKNKAGLHKEISSIFKGVQIPRADGGQEPSGPPAPERTDYTEPKQPAPELQDTEAPKAYQATPSLPKAAPVRQPKAEPAQRPKTEPVHLPEFVTAQQSDVEPAQRPKAEPVRQPKVVPARQPKADIDKNVSQKRPIVKISSQSFRQQIKDKLFKPKPGVSTAKQKAMLVIVPLLSIALIFMLFRGGVFGTSAGKTEAVAENNASGVAAAGSNTEIEWELPAPYPTTLRDPMRLVPAATAQTEQGENREIIKLIVRSILYSEDNPSAVIGSRIVHEGEKIQDVSVIKINTDSVEFEMNGKRWTQMVQR